jgi:tetratricopeptide (TPR) repeat protein
MRVKTAGLLSCLLMAALMFSGCSFYSKLRARDQLNKGVQAFTESEYVTATKFFEEAVRLDPDFEVARMYLATSYSQQYIPGSPDPTSTQMAQDAIKTFKEVVDSKPDNPNLNAMISVASLYYQLREYDNAKEWCAKIQKVDPNNADAMYRVAVIDYDDAVGKTGLQGEGVEFLSEEDKAHTLQNIEEGIAMLEKALQIRPDYFDAMEYQNLLLREKAKFEKDEAAKAKLVQQADLVAQKALQLRLKSEEEEAKKPRKLAK